MPKRIITKRIGEILMERGAITPTQLEEALAYAKAHGGQIGEVLVKLGFIDEEAVARALTAQYGFPYLPLENYEIDRALTAEVPERLARQYCLIPVDRTGNALTLVMADPSNDEAIRAVGQLTKCVVQVCLSTPSAIMQAIDRHYTSRDTGQLPSTRS